MRRIVPRPMYMADSFALQRQRGQRGNAALTDMLSQLLGRSTGRRRPGISKPAETYGHEVGTKRAGWERSLGMNYVYRGSSAGVETRRWR
jgi:hypothetical protein